MGKDIVQFFFELLAGADQSVIDFERKHIMPSYHAQPQHYLLWSEKAQEAFTKALGEKRNLLKIMNEFGAMPYQDMRVTLQKNSMKMPS